MGEWVGRYHADTESATTRDPMLAIKPRDKRGEEGHRRGGGGEVEERRRKGRGESRVGGGGGGGGGGRGSEEKKKMYIREVKVRGG